MTLTRNNRDKHGAGTADVDVQALGVKVTELERELAMAQERLDTARTRVEVTQSMLADAQAVLDRIESRHLAGRASDSELAQARAAQAKAKQQHAVAQVECDDAERMARILPEAIAEAKGARLVAIRDRLRRQTAEKAAQLAALLAEAKQVSDDLLTLHDEAVRQFPVPQLLQVGGMLVGAQDLGEQGGYVTTAAGIPVLHCGWLTNDGNPKELSLFDIWLREVQAYLSVTPEQRAQADRESRVATLACAKQQQKDAVVNEQARVELRRRLAERYGISPSEVMM